VFVRIYLKNSMNIYRGADSNGAKKDVDQVWINPENGVIIHDQPDQTRCIYSCLNIGDFKCYLWKDSEFKDFFELFNVPEKKTELTNED